MMVVVLRTMQRLLKCFVVFNYCGLGIAWRVLSISPALIAQQWRGHYSVLCTLFESSLRSIPVYLDYSPYMLVSIFQKVLEGHVLHI